MNLVDVALVVLLIFCALRGFWRGLIREAFGLAALLLGLAAALRLTAEGVAALEQLRVLGELPPVARAGIAFVAVFLAVSAIINIIGFLFDRLAARGPLRQVSRVSGGVFGFAKGGVVLSFVLLFLHLFPFIDGFERQIVASRLARPMIAGADTVLRQGWGGVGSAEERA
jgi:membrane protein required for colicin V production